MDKATPAGARALDDDEIARLLRACDDAERAWVLVGLGCGVRISEALAVRTDTLDFLRGQLTVGDQARTPTAGPPVLAPTQNRKVRTIPLTPSLLEVLARHVERTIPERDGHRNGLLFPATGGWLQRRGGATGRFAKIVRRAGLRGITWHNLRDTAATTMLRAGLNPAFVARSLGNSIQIMLARYAGTPDDVELARSALDRITAIEAAL